MNFLVVVLSSSFQMFSEVLRFFIRRYPGICSSFSEKEKSQKKNTIVVKAVACGKKKAALLDVEFHAPPSSFRN